MKKQTPTDKKFAQREQGHMTRPPRLDGQTKRAHQDRVGKKEKKEKE